MPTIADDDHPEWYNARDGDDGTKVLDGLDGTLEFIKEFILKQDEPFDAVMGHSQGAQLAAILTLLLESDKTWLPKYGMPWKLLVLLSPPNPFDTEATLADRVKKHGRIKTPSLHVYGGEKDYTLAGSKAMRLKHFGEDSTTVREFSHDEGHFGPDDNEEKCLELVAIMSEMLESLGG